MAGSREGLGGRWSWSSQETFSQEKALVLASTLREVRALGLGSGAPRVQLSNSGQEPLCPWEVQGMRERCPNLPTPLAREAVTLLLNVHKEGRNRQGNSLKSWAPGQF